ncbi:LptF/LptG family permease [Cyanobacterium aponinum AL20118]|uniref:Permease YjgP/YjgQ family protein n=3 Tax=Cyanobacterium aponinum TaxID=379064 RepID=K9Z943_CYAAP|nr:LptF/LptG family permease [Cyanobacterium aponinum]AFZ54908.1 permease YjgP/YjgQ family protein [Cyanobacterium aponinum PCC 10605]MBD2395864.1 LptF/LptG family permease [Cyanobacterium aponinum FACHB-4101]MTF39850.1 LptF/LptG family permease [Cyanobacterium aponinum 0216]PHV64390.1 YjgP/YjgQ family permease [Cyanobacterium aponinum IPPAS B-1201]WPF88166.1 LptF/LptG family permease [Cyanobacterium aponinum AL20115]
MDKEPKFFLPLPKISVMDRYVTVELLLPFLFGIGLFTSLGLSIGTLFELIRKVTESGLLLSVAFKILFLRMPGFIALAFPMSLLLATLMAYSRLSSDSEIIALRSVGVNIYRLVIPAVILSLCVTGMTFFINDVVTPSANREATLTMQRALNRVRPTFKDRNILYPEYKTVQYDDGSRHSVLERLFYAQEFNGEEMKDLTILDLSREGLNQILTAKTATWNIGDNVWDFFNGTIYLISPDGAYRNIVRFEHQQLALSRAPLDLAQRPPNPDEMSISQAREYLEVVKLQADEKEIRKMMVRIQGKISLPFVCVVFGLIGSALGLRPQNTNKATSFGICVGLIFSYYLLSFVSESMGIWGILTPLMAAWLPNLLGLGVGTWLLVQSAK